MQALQASECCDHILLFGQFAGLVEKKLLFGQIFLEVIVAEFLVDFPLVVECFHGILIVFPYRSGVLWRHFAYLFEFALYLLDTLIVTVDIVSVGAKSFKFVDQGFLFVKISGLTCFYLGSLTRFLLFDGGKGSLEPFFDRIFGVSECFALFAGFILTAECQLIVECIELLLDSGNVIGDNFRIVGDNHFNGLQQGLTGDVLFTGAFGCLRCFAGELFVWQVRRSNFFI